MVACVGEVSESLLAGLARSPNIALARPPDADPDPLAAAARALAEAARRAATYVLVPADPLAGVAAQWRAMWDLSAGPGAAAAFEDQAAAALAAWRARQFELPDYYLVVTPAAPAPQVPASRGPAPRGPAPRGPAPRGPAAPPSARPAVPPPAPGGASSVVAVPDLYLGPLRSARPRRVEAVIAGDGDAAAGRVVQALRALPHGPWWPPLDELLDTARHFFAGSLDGAGVQGHPGG